MENYKIVRDHDKNLFEAKKHTLRLIEKNMNEKWGKGTVTLTIKDQYKNMSEIIRFFGIMTKILSFMAARMLVLVCSM